MEVAWTPTTLEKPLEGWFSVKRKCVSVVDKNACPPSCRTESECVYRFVTVCVTMDTFRLT